MQLTAIAFSKPWTGQITKTWRVMRIFSFLLLAGCLQVSASGLSQTITFAGKNIHLEQLFRVIKMQTGYTVVINKELLQETKPITLNAQKKEIREFLNQILSNQGLTFEIRQTTIVIARKEMPSTKKTNPLNVELPPLRGVVKDERGSPIPSVSVVIPGTPFGDMTNERGEFSIPDAPSDAELLFSYVGYKSLRIKINARQTINVVLLLDDSEMEETVVIAYGTTTKTKSTGSIGSIKAEEIAKQPVSNPLNALQGRIAGALVTQSNGLPGSRVTIQIRGINSIDQTGAGTQPLYLVDGVPFNITDNSIPQTNDLNGRGSYAAAGGLSPFSVINPADIESINILKDADATAIYGTRGANGVVLITTKKGKAGKTKYDVSLQHGHGKVGHFIPMMNIEQYLQMRREAYINDGIEPDETSAPDLLVWDQTANTDWQKRYLGGTAKYTDAQATASGGDSRTRFLLNAGYHLETPVFPGDFKSERISTRLNLDHNSLDRKFNVNVSLNYAFENTDLLSEDLSSVYNLPPNMPLFNSDGSIKWDANFTNPESYLLVNYFGKTHNLMTNTTLRYNILSGLDVKATFGFNRVQLNQNTQNPVGSKDPFNPFIRPTNSASFATIDQQSYNFEPQILYSKDIFNGQFSALLGSTFNNTINTSLRMRADDYSTPLLLGSVNGAGTVYPPEYGYTKYRFNSIFSRITYDWASKYLLNAVYRRDGSSRFGPGNKFGNFWSLGAGWVFTNEDFVKSLKFLSFGKLRGSYGKTGNDQIQDYQYASFFVANGSYQGNSALMPDRVSNSAVRWQTTYKAEVGLELGFFKNRVELNVNYYNNRTPDQLGYLNLSPQTGFNAYVANFNALIRNKGWEFELNTQNIMTKNFSWRSSLNLTIPRTILVNASPDYFYYNQSAIGQQLSADFGYTYKGVDPETGNPLFRDATKDSLTFFPNFRRDRSVLIFTAPKVYGGLNNVFSYKTLELSFFFQYTRQDGQILPYPPSFDPTPGPISTGNLPTYWLDRWMKPGDVKPFPRVTSSPFSYFSFASSNATRGDASFLRLRTISLAYTIPTKITEKWRVENLRVNLQAQNVWWTSNNRYVYDPETGTSMPPLRMITAGINVTF